MRAFTFTRRVALFVVAGGLVVGLVVGPLVAPSRAASSLGFRLVVNPESPMTVLERRFVVEAFLKKTTRWPDGSLIRPVDLGPESPTRQRFSDDVLGRSPAAVKSYWQQALFAGRELPPPEVDTDDDVIRYVLKYPGAIGYVSGGADVGRVKPVTLK